ncbi:peptide deformylase [Candidatus Parcubacteria bacterium]|nr:MAG: peptide deformylase [Candidatus Parcubacteria bacterium]
MLPIVKTPNQVLMEPSKPVTEFDKKLLNIITEMKESLLATTDPKGVGLAAPQVGIPLKIFLAKPNDKSPILVFINPQIKEITETQPKSSKKKGRLLEGCLSIPSIWGKVSRNASLTIEYQDESGKKHTKVAKGFLAIIIQHEMDHLQGILFTKRVMEQNQKLFRSYKNEKGEDEFEEIKI